MFLQFVEHLLEQGRQTGRHLGMILVHALDLGSQGDQFRQLPPVYVVEAADDEVDQGVGVVQRVGGRVIQRLRAQLREFALNSRQVELARLRGRFQGHVATAAEVQPVAPEHGGGTRQIARQLAQGEAGER